MVSEPHEWEQLVQTVTAASLVLACISLILVVSAHAPTPQLAADTPQAHDARPDRASFLGSVERAMR